MKIIQFLKKNANIIVGVMLVAGFVGILGIYRLYQNKEWNNNQIYTEDMLRAENTEILETPFESAGYFVEAILAGDVDKAMRGCAIGEKCWYNNYKLLMEQRVKNGLDIDIAPMFEENFYYPINAAIFAEEYQKQISFLVKQIEAKELEFREVNYVDKTDVSLDEYKKEQLIRRAWGAESVEELLIRLEDKEENSYMMALTVAEFKENGWKVLNIGSEILGLTHQNTVQEVEKQVYSKAVDKEKSKKKYSEKAENKNEQNKEIEDQILPLNYFTISQKSEKSVNSLMEEFTAYIQRKDILGAMNYIKLDEEKEIYEAQRIVAEQMRDLCKGLMGIRDTNQNPRLWNPEEFTYLGFNGVYSIDKEHSEEKVVIYYYDSKFYAVGCRFVKIDNQWMIQEFTELDRKAENQIVVEITKMELEQLRNYQDNEE